MEVGVRRTADSCRGLRHSSLISSLLFTALLRQLLTPSWPTSPSQLTPTQSSPNSFCLQLALSPNLFISPQQLCFPSSSRLCCSFYSLSSIFFLLISPSGLSFVQTVILQRVCSVLQNVSRSDCRPRGQLFRRASFFVSRVSNITWQQAAGTNSQFKPSRRTICSRFTRVTMEKMMCPELGRI